MAILDDLKAALEDYATNNCKTEIVNFLIAAGGGAVLNVGDTFTFQVRVTNESHLDMRSVTIRTLGTSFADVALSSGAFGSSVTTVAFNLDAHQSHITGLFRGKATAITSGSKDIVTARINSWDASFDHLLKAHTGSGAAEGRLNRVIASA